MRHSGLYSALLGVLLLGVLLLLLLLLCGDVPAGSLLVASGSQASVLAVAARLVNG
jgi:hypothetical protein